MPRVQGSDVLDVLHRVVRAVSGALEGVQDWEWDQPGARDGQYGIDLLADKAAVEVIDAAGFGALSEESGLHAQDRPIMVVVDPVDGSTNASRRIPWWATSVCALDGEGPLAAVVANQASGVVYEAVRAEGARCNGRVLTPSRCERMPEAIVALSGYPNSHFGWAQFRSLGAAALDICAVAAGSLDAFVDCAENSLAPWDYMGALLVCREVAVPVVDAEGRDLVVVDPSQRRAVVAACTPPLLAAAVESRARHAD